MAESLGFFRDFTRHNLPKMTNGGWRISGVAQQQDDRMF
jgi:hypothetical protein